MSSSEAKILFLTPVSYTKSSLQFRLISSLQEKSAKSKILKQFVRRNISERRSLIFGSMTVSPKRYRGLKKQIVALYCVSTPTTLLPISLRSRNISNWTLETRWNAGCANSVPVYLQPLVLSFKRVNIEEWCALYLELLMAMCQCTVTNGPGGTARERSPGSLDGSFESGARRMGCCLDQKHSITSAWWWFHHFDRLGLLPAWL